MDYVNVLFVAASTALVLGLTWAGSTYAWSSFRVLVPLILGFLGIVAFVFIEHSYVKHPTVPFAVLKNRTTLVGFVQTFIHSLIMMCIVYVQYRREQLRGHQAHAQSPTGTTCRRPTSKPPKGFRRFAPALLCSPSACACSALTFHHQPPADEPPSQSTVAPAAIVTGAWVTITQKYKLQNLVGWTLATVGSGLLILFRWDSNKGIWAGIPIVVGIGLGILYTGTQFAVLAPIAPADQPPAVRPCHDASQKRGAY